MPPLRAVKAGLSVSGVRASRQGCLVNRALTRVLSRFRMVVAVRNAGAGEDTRMRVGEKARVWVSGQPLRCTVVVWTGGRALVELESGSRLGVDADEVTPVLKLVA